MMMRADLPFMEQVRLIQLIRSVQQPSDDLCLDQPAGQALYLMARSLDRAAEHLHDVGRQRSKFNASGLPLPSGNRAPYYLNLVRQFSYTDKEPLPFVLCF